MLGRKFVPSLVSNVVFLLATIQSVSITVVNFKGRPFMRGIIRCDARLAQRYSATRPREYTTAVVLYVPAQ